ncbi:hypothetical protein [Kocuria sabuli]|uniref:hypothetical protein n=1 Tax=Kocuria sabuli TaxID=3071448 RepID=UPI0034D5342F
MSLQQFFDDARRPTTTDATPVRVFPFVAPTPRLPEPKGWNHPLGVLLVTMSLIVTIATIPGVPPTLVAASLGISLTLTVLGSLSYSTWPGSRAKALIEGTWVAGQSGYRVHRHGNRLYWFAADGTVKDATVVRGEHGWDLVLTDRSASDRFSF